MISNQFYFYTFKSIYVRIVKIMSKNNILKKYLNFTKNMPYPIILPLEAIEKCKCINCRNFLDDYTKK